ADDLAFAGVPVVLQVVVVFFVERGRHKNLDVPAENLARLVAEEALAGRVEHLNEAIAADQDHAVDGGVDQRPQALGRFAQRLFALLALRDVVNDADEGRLTVLLRFSHGQVHGKCRAVLAAADDFAADADDLTVAGAPVILQVSVVLAVEGSGHQYFDV